MIHYKFLYNYNISERELILFEINKTGFIFFAVDMVVN